MEVNWDQLRQDMEAGRTTVSILMLTLRGAVQEIATLRSVAGQREAEIARLRDELADAIVKNGALQMTVGQMNAAVSAKAVEISLGQVQLIGERAKRAAALRVLERERARVKRLKRRLAATKKGSKR